MKKKKRVKAAAVNFGAEVETSYNQNDNDIEVISKNILKVAQTENQ